MYEEEYFVSIVKGSDKDQTTKTPLVHKYFSELSAEQLQAYDFDDGNQQSMFRPGSTLERGSILGQSMTDLTAWTSDIAQA